MPIVVDLKSVVIASGGTIATGVGGFDDAEALCIYAPAALTGTVTLQVASQREASEGGSTATWSIMQSGGTDITIPAGRCVTLTDIAFRQLRLVSGSAEGADRTFLITKQVYPRGGS